MSQNKFKFGDLLSSELVPNELRDLLTAQEKRLVHLESDREEHSKVIAKLKRERQPRQRKVANLEGDLAAIKAQVNEVKVDHEDVLHANQVLTENLKACEAQLEVAKSQEENDTNDFCVQMRNLDEEWTNQRSTWVTDYGVGKVEEAQDHLRRNKGMNIILHKRLLQLQQQIFGFEFITRESDNPHY